MAAIDKQAAIDALDEICDRECEYSKAQRYVMCGSCRLGSAFDAIEGIPTAQPTGRWEKQSVTDIEDAGISEVQSAR